MPLVPIILASLSVVAPKDARQSAPPACRIMGAADQVAHRVSPFDSASVEIGGGTVMVCYGRPSARGRTIMGGLVPYGEPWRLGANEATTIAVPFALDIGRVRVAPGTYSLYAIPGASTWMIVVNRNAARWGIPIDSTVRAQDLGVDTIAVEKVDGQPIETLTLRFGPPSGGATELIVEWEKTRVRLPIRKAS